MTNWSYSQLVYDNMDTFERLDEILADKRLSLEDISSITGVTYRTLMRYRAGDREPKAAFFKALYDHLDISITWLLTGKGDRLVSDGENLSAAEKKAPQFVPIPKFTVSASAGNGANPSDELVEGTYAFNKTWLERRGLKPKSLSVVSVRGDSMEPDLSDGDLILIDSAATRFMDGSIYAVRFSDDLFVKRIQHLPGKRMLLISSNKRYPPIEVKHPEADGVQVIGRIVASMHEW